MGAETMRGLGFSITILKEFSAMGAETMRGLGLFLYNIKRV
jgi:hypothetical protein